MGFFTPVTVSNELFATFFPTNPAYLFRAFLLEADDVQVEVFPEPVAFVEGDAPGQALPARLGTQTQPGAYPQNKAMAFKVQTISIIHFWEGPH